MTKGNIGSSRGLLGRPTVISFPLTFSKVSSGYRGCTADTVSIMKSMVPIAACAK